MTVQTIPLPILALGKRAAGQPRRTDEQLRAIVAADTPLALWDEMRIHFWRLGCTDMASVELADPVCQAQPRPDAIAAADPDRLRGELAACNGAPVLLDRVALVLPAYGPRGLEAALVVRLVEPAAALPDWADTNAALFQFAYVRFRAMCPIGRNDEVPLSEREREIMQWVMRGKSNSVIGDILGISASTVDTYMRRIFRKLDVGDRTSAAMRAVSLGAVS